MDEFSAYKDICDEEPPSSSQAGACWEYNCPKCDKSFSREDNLKTHSLIHSGEKPHKCTHCDYSCSDPSPLKTYMK